jgi:hypothetical protein
VGGEGDAAKVISISSVLAPPLRATRSAAKPAVPAPMMATSHFTSIMARLILD